MQRFISLLTWVAVLLGFAAPAEAGPVFVALLSAGAGIGAAFSATAVGSFLTTTFLGRLLGSIALSALQAALMPKPATPGITTEFTQTGGVNPCAFILGTYATAGDFVGPPMSHGTVGKTPNAYLTYVISLGDVAGQTLSRVLIDGAYVTFSGAAHADYGTPATGRLAGYAWLKYRDGTQTVADTMLRAKYGAYPERPWLADMVGTGVCHAILTFRYNRDLYQNLPQCRFEMAGIKLYDPRKDSSVGGSGAHRWANPATWEPTVNPVVMAYNIKRGITLTGLGIWGGAAAAADLPLAAWFSAMNACDATVALAAGGTEARYRAGYEVTVDKEPAAVIEELLKACAGQVAEVGGQWKVRVGGPGLPVMFFTDDDIIVTRAQDYDPFPTSDQRMNGIDARFPDPASGWDPKSAPPRYNATWEAEDGGKRRTASLDLPACPFPNQVQRVMKGYITDERRFRRHTLTLPPEAAILEPLDVISWTSVRNGYSAKLFDLSEVQDDLRTLLQGVAMREVDPSDYDWTTGLELAWSDASSAPVPVPEQTVESFDLLAHTITDAGSVARRPALRLTWNGAEQDGVTAIEYEIRVAATAVVIKRGTITDVNAGALVVAEGILASTAYEARMRPVVAGPVAWTAWDAATTAALPLGQIDLDGSVVKGVLIGPVDIPTTVGYTFLTISTGAIAPHQLWRAGVSAELKHISGSAAELEFEQRFKFAGAWSAWVQKGTLTTTTVWDVDGVSSGFAGQYEDVEFRLVVKTNGGLRVLSLRNVYMTATNIVKS